METKIDSIIPTAEEIRSQMPLSEEELNLFAIKQVSAIREAAREGKSCCAFCITERRAVKALLPRFIEKGFTVDSISCPTAISWEVTTSFVIGVSFPGNGKIYHYRSNFPVSVGSSVLVSVRNGHSAIPITVSEIMPSGLYHGSIPLEQLQFIEGIA